MAADRDPRWTSKVEPAPAELRIVQAFVATAARGSDALASPRALADWLGRWGLLAADAELGDADLERARVARAGLRALMAGSSGRKVDAEAVAGLDRAASEACFRLRFEAVRRRATRRPDPSSGCWRSSPRSRPPAAGRGSSSAPTPPAARRSTTSPPTARPAGARRAAATG